MQISSTSPNPGVAGSNPARGTKNIFPGERKVIKRIALTILTIVLVFSLCACGNRDMFDIVHTFDRVIVKLADGSIVEGKC